MESQTLAHGPRQPARGAWAEGPGAETLVLGRYRLRERLGAGGFGVVYRADDELLHREVAVKRIALAPEEDGERATRAALASARLSHPAIVALYEACAEQDAFYLISELVDGHTLGHLIAAGTLDDEQVLRIGVAMCSALEHAHTRGVIHRDVKPHNVLIPSAPAADAAGADDLGAVAKLTDFGGARLSGQDVLTRTGDVLGTLAYMAPEQSEGRAAEEASDLYSLGLVLYEAMCGVNPVRGSTPAETVRRIGRPLPSLARSRRDLPRELTRALDRCLAPVPRTRGTIEELAGTLVWSLEDDERTLQRTRILPRRPRRASARAEAGEEPAVDVLEQARQLAMPVLERAPERHPRDGGDGLPRLLWLALALALAIWQTAAGRTGVGLLALAALLPIVLVPVGRRAQGGAGGWLLCALAPALGAVGLAGAFPAIAGQARRWRMRAALGALGYWWLALAEPLLGKHLWLGPLSGTPAHAAWEGSLQSTAVHVVGPLLSTGILLGAALWACGAAVLPLLVRGRGAALDVVAASIWSAALAVSAPLLDGGLPAQLGHVSPRGAIVGAVLGGTLAVAARAVRGPV